MEANNLIQLELNFDFLYSKRHSTLIFGNSSANARRRKVKVAFLICNDVLVEVLRYFDRRQLAKVERLCRRFHRIVVRCFNEAPILFFEVGCHIKEKSRRFSKIFSSPDTEEEYCRHLLVFIFV